MNTNNKTYLLKKGLLWGCFFSLFPCLQAGDGLWVWERKAQEIVESTDPQNPEVQGSALDQLVTFCKNQNITEVYFSALKRFRGKNFSLLNPPPEEMGIPVSLDAVSVPTTSKVSLSELQVQYKQFQNKRQKWLLKNKRNRNTVAYRTERNQWMEQEREWRKRLATAEQAEAVSVTSAAPVSLEVHSNGTKAIFYPKWEAVLTTLHKHGIRVEALLGSVDWLYPVHPVGGEDRAYGLGLFQEVLDYQMTHADKVEQGFDGVHFDVEPENLFIEGLGIEENIRQRSLYFLDFIADVHAKRAQNGFSVSNLPFHWDADMDMNISGRAVIADPNDATDVKPAWQHFLDRLENITFMTYRNQAFRIIFGMKDELAYLDLLPSQGQPLVRFALEYQEKFGDHHLVEDTTQMEEGLVVPGKSVAKEDRLTVFNLIEEVRSLMQNRDYFQGFAHHPYDNKDPENGQYPSWIETSGSLPAKIEFTQVGETLEIPSNNTEAIDDPVYFELRVKADPKFQFRNTAKWFQDMIHVIPVGYGYCSEERLQALNSVAHDPNKDEPYNGIFPTRWWFFADESIPVTNQVRWWPNPNVDDVTADLTQKGVSWKNPATQDYPDLGVVRKIKLQRGKFYRFIVLYSPWDDFASQYMTRSLVAEDFAARAGDQPQRPIGLSFFLGERSRKVDPDHLVTYPNHSYFIYDLNGDGKHDGMPGDADHNYRIDERDIDALQLAASSKTPFYDASKDLDRDGKLTYRDTVKLVREIFHTYEGDINLDGVTGRSDLEILKGKFNQQNLNLKWVDGDLNGDHVVDIVDFGILAGTWGLGGLK